MWQGLCRSLDLSELAGDARFATASDRLTNREELWQLLEAAFLEKDAAEHVDNLQCNDVPAALIKRVPEALEDARTAGRGMRSEERRVGKECVRTCRSRWSP